MGPWISACKYPGPPASQFTENVVGLPTLVLLRPAPLARHFPALEGVEWVTENGDLGMCSLSSLTSMV